MSCVIVVTWMALQDIVRNLNKIKIPLFAFVVVFI